MPRSSLNVRGYTRTCVPAGREPAGNDTITSRLGPLPELRHVAVGRDPPVASYRRITAVSPALGAGPGGNDGQCPAAPAAGGSGTVASITGELSSARWSGPGGGRAAEIAPIAPSTSLPSMRKSKFDALLRTDGIGASAGRPVSPGTAASPGAMPRLPRRCQP